MSTFINRIKEALSDPRKARAMGDKIAVFRGDLVELLHHFERLDDEVRRHHEVSAAQYGQVQEAVQNSTFAPVNIDGELLPEFQSDKPKSHSARGSAKEDMGVTHCAKCSRITEVFGCNWCASCYYPGIDSDFEEFQFLIDEGYSRADAATRSGWMGTEEADAK